MSHSQFTDEEQRQIRQSATHDLAAVFCWILGLLSTIMGIWCGLHWAAESGNRSECANGLISTLSAQACANIAEQSTWSAIGFFALLAFGIFLMRQGKIRS